MLRRNVVKAGVVLPLAVCVAVVGAGCTQQASGGNGGGSGDSAQAEAAAAEPTANAVAADLYREAIANPASYFENKGLDSALVQSGEYSYALAKVEGLDAPVLLLCLHGDEAQAGGDEAQWGGDEAQWGGVDAVSVLYVDANGSLADCGQTLSRGVAAAGGYRGEVYASAYGDGLLVSEVSSGTGTTSAARLLFDGQAWTKRKVYTGKLMLSTACAAPLEAEQRDLTWTSAGDSSVLDALAGETWKSNIDASAADLATSAEQAGLQVLTGTVRVLDTEGLCELQGVSDPSPGYPQASAFTVLVFDEKTQVTATSGGGYGTSTEEAALVLLATDDAAWDTYDGQRVTVAIDAAATWWPSDASLPLGEPKARSFSVLTR